MYALAADDVSARLEALLDHDPGTNDLSACCLYQINQPLQCLSVCKEIIDQEHFVPFSEKLLRNDDVINSSVRVRLYLRTINLSCDIFRLCLFRKNDRNIKLLRYDTGNADTRSLYRKDFVDLGSLKAALEFLSDLPEQPDIHLVIQKTVYLQYISLFYLSILTDAVLKQLHCSPSIFCCSLYQ